MSEEIAQRFKTFMEFWNTQRLELADEVASQGCAVVVLL